MKQITLIGNIGKVELKKKEHGFNLCFNLAVNTQYTNNQAEIVKKTDWFFCNKFYKNEPKGLMKFFKSGLLVAVNGNIDFSTTEKDGKSYFNKSVSVQELQVLTPKGDS